MDAREVAPLLRYVLVGDGSRQLLEAELAVAIRVVLGDVLGSLGLRQRFATARALKDARAEFGRG